MNTDSSWSLEDYMSSKIVCQVYDWRLDISYAWRLDISYAWRLDISYAWRLDISYAWRLDISYAWRLDISYAWRLDISYAWRLDISYAWRLDITYAWRLDISYAWRLDISGTYKKFWPMSSDCLFRSHVWIISAWSTWTSWREAKAAMHHPWFRWPSGETFCSDRVRKLNWFSFKSHAQLLVFSRRFRRISRIFLSLF